MVKTTKRQTGSNKTQFPWMSCYIMSSEWSRGWCLRFQGQFNYWGPNKAFCHFFPSDQGILAHSSYKGQRSTPQPSLNPDRQYPLQFREETSISRGLRATMMCLWVSPSCFLSNESASNHFHMHLSLTHLWWVNCKQLISWKINTRRQPKIDSQAHWNCF